MNEHPNSKVDTLTIPIPIRLQCRGGRKLIITRQGVAPTPSGAATRR
jgi:hypothetical protein